MSQVKFYNVETELDENKAIENGAIYFCAKSDGTAEVAYDMNNNRYWVNYPTITNVAGLVSTWTPRAGEIIVVSDASTLDGNPVPSIKIGNGVSNSIELPYISDDTDISALRNIVDRHLQDSNVHHTVGVTGTTYIIEEHAPINDYN